MIHVVRAASWLVDKDGNELWRDEPVYNILHDEGEQAILSAFFDTDLATYGPPPASLYIGLDSRTTLAEDDTLASLTGEPTTGGYARKAVSTTTGFTLAQPADFYRATSQTVSFTAAGGNIGTVRNRFLTTVASGTGGKLICSLALSTPRTINEGDTLNTNFIIGLAESA